MKVSKKPNKKIHYETSSKTDKLTPGTGRAETRLCRGRWWVEILAASLTGCIILPVLNISVTSV